MADQTIRIDVIARAQTQALNRAKRDIMSLGAASSQASAQAAGGLATLGRVSQGVGTALIAGVAVGLAVGAKAAIDFETSFAGVRKTVEASESEFERLARSIRDLALDIPINVNDLNRIAELGGQLGIGAGELEAFTEVIAKLGVTTNLEIDEAATSIARFANVMGTSHGDFDRLASTVVDLGNNFATTESEILSFGTRLAGIGKVVGLSEAEVLGLSAAFTALGEPAERGATALQAVFITMLGAVEGGGPKLQTFADILGITVEEFEALFELDPVKAFILFEKGLNNIAESGGDVSGVLQSLGLGARRTTGLLLKGAVGWESLEEAVRNAGYAYGDNLALDEEAEKRFGTTQSQIQLLVNAFRDLSITLGEKTLGPIRSVVEVLKGMIDVIADGKEVLDGFIFLIAALLASRMLIRLGKSIGNIGMMLGEVFGSQRIFYGAQNLVGVFGKMAMGAKLLGGILGILVAAFGAFVIVAGQARARTNKMYDAVERLNKLLNDPDASTADRITGFEETLLSATATADDRLWSMLADNDTGRANLREVKRILHGYDVAWTDFVDAALDEGARFNKIESDVLGGIRREIEQVQSLFPSRPGQAGAIAGGRGGSATLIPTERLQDLYRRRDLLTELFNKTRQLFGINRELQLQASKEAEVAGGFTLEKELAAIRGSGLVAGQITDELMAHDNLVKALEIYLEPEQVDDFLDDFNGIIVDFGDDFTDNWNDIIEDFDANLSDWEEIWDDYKSVVAPSVDAIKTSIKAWREDNRRLLATEKEVFSEMDHEHRLFWLSLPVEMQRGLAALREQDPDAFQDLFETMFTEGMNQSLDSLEHQMNIIGTVAAQYLKDNWPPILEAAIAEAGDKGIVEGSAEWETLMGEAWDEMIAQVALKDPLLAAELQRLMEAGAGAILFNRNLFNEAWDVIISDLTAGQRTFAFYQMGLDWAKALLLGFASYGIPEATQTEIDKAVAAIKQAGEEGLLISSPSGVGRYWGQMVAEGFNLGLGDGMGRQLDSQFLSSSRMPISSNRVMSNITEIHVHHPNHPTDDLTADLQRASVLAGFQRIAESRPLSN